MQTKDNELNMLKDKVVKLNGDIEDIEKNLKRLKPQLIDASKELDNLMPQLEDAYDVLYVLHSQLHDAENKLNTYDLRLNQDEILDLKFIIKKLKKEKIPSAQDELYILKKKHGDLRKKFNVLQEKRISLEEKKKVLEEEIDNTEKYIEKLQQEEEYRKDRLYKRLYVEFDDDVLSKVFMHFDLHESSIDDNLKLLVDKYSEDQIYDFIDFQQNEEKRKEELIMLCGKFDEDSLSKVFKHFKLNENSDEDNLKLLFDKYSADEISNFIEIENKRIDYLDQLRESEEEFKNFIKNHIEELCDIYPVSRYSKNIVARLKYFLIKDDSVEEVVESIKLKK